MAASTPPRPINRSEFEVAIICALPIESDAVESLFDHFWDENSDHYGKAPGDENAYTTGVIGKHNVVLAYMPDIGKGHAAKVAANLRISFRAIKLALLVGICGGVPSGDTGQLFLGDVVVCDEIVVYDFGRMFPRNFIRKDTLMDHYGSSSTEIRAFLTKLKTRRGRQNLLRRTGHHLAALQKETGDYGFPGIRHDRLFDPKYHHRHHKQSCQECSKGQICKEARSSTCGELQCNEKRVIVRSRMAQALESLGAKHASLRIHFGRIASADTVMKSGEDRDNIAKREKVLGFEMEGAGILNSLPCIVVKGVSDYADSHKDKIWQSYAAGTAAACTKALLEQWTITDRSSPAAASIVNANIPHPLNETNLASIVSTDESSQCLPDTLDSSIGQELKTENAIGFGHSSQSSPEPVDPQHAMTWRDNIPVKAEEDTNLGATLFEMVPAIEECFDRVLYCLRESRNNLPRDTDLRSILNTQRVILRTVIEAVLLLGKVSLETAQYMAADPDHPMWQDKALYDRVYDSLGPSNQACLEVAHSIQQKLIRLADLANGIKSLGKRRMSDMKSQSSFDFLKDSAQDLRLLIQHFSFLVPSRRESRLVEDATACQLIRADKDLKRFRAIQQTASSLYLALGSACSAHPIHDVHLTLHPQVDETSTKVQFSVALLLNTEDLEVSRSVWLDVKSTITPRAAKSELPSRLYGEPSSSSPTETLLEDPDTKHGPSKSGKHVRFLRSSHSSLSEASDTVMHVRDLRVEGKLCDIIQQPVTHPDRCVGSLGRVEEGRHLVYMARQLDQTGVTPTVLSQLILRSKNDFTNGLSLYERVRLARELATAVLHYHATPWLDRVWFSDDIYLFTDGNGNQILRQNPQTPFYLNTSVAKSGSSISPSHRFTECEELIRNPVLFGLGVMFLELAYQSPLSTFSESIDQMHGKLPGLVAFSAVKRLASKVHSVISASFRRIVEKCLYCDFGCGNNFKSPALQQAFHRDVIVGLGELEGFFQKLQLDDQV